MPSSTQAKALLDYPLPPSTARQHCRTAMSGLGTVNDVIESEASSGWMISGHIYQNPINPERRTRIYIFISGWQTTDNSTIGIELSSEGTREDAMNARDHFLERLNEITVFEILKLTP